MRRERRRMSYTVYWARFHFRAHWAPECNQRVTRPLWSSCEYIKESEVKALCAKAREILIEESNVQRVDAPVTVRHVAVLR